jgi:hypothetical protein
MSISICAGWPPADTSAWKMSTQTTFAAQRQGLKVLFTTGYTRNAIVHHSRLDPGVQLIGKPFSFSELSVKIRALLDR